MGSESLIPCHPESTTLTPLIVTVYAEAEIPVGGGDITVRYSALPQSNELVGASLNYVGNIVAFVTGSEVNPLNSEMITEPEKQAVRDEILFAAIPAGRVGSVASGAKKLGIFERAFNWLTTKKVAVSGDGVAPNKVSDGIRYESYWDNLADTPASLTNREARAWYLSRELEIPAPLDTTKSLEYQARQAFEIRNDLRSSARDLMADQNLANNLRINEPNLSFDELVEIKSISNSGDDVWNSIINSSQKSRQSVNEQFNFIGDRPRYD